MPTVPSYDLPTQELAAMQLSQFQAPDVKPMSDVAGKQLSEMGDAQVKTGAVLQKIADNIHFEKSEAEAKRFDNELSESYRGIMMQGENAYMTKNGKDAVDGAAPTLDTLKDAQKKIEERITDPLQLAMFRDAASKRYNLAAQQVDAHALQQLKVFNINESKSRVSNAVNDYVANIGDPKAATLFKNTAVAEVDSMATTLGIPKGSAQYKDMMLETTTKMHTEVISNYIAIDKDGAAAAYFKAHKGEIAQDKHDDINRVLQQSGTKDQSLNIALSLKGTLQENIAAANAMYRDGKINASVRDAVVNRVEHNWKMQQGEQAAFERTVVGQAQDWLLKNPNKSLSDMDPRLYTNLKNTGHLATIQSFAKNGRFEQNPKAWGEVIGMPANQLAEYTPDQFYNKFRGSLDNEHLERGMAMVVEARGEGKGKGTQLVTNNEVINRAAKEAKIIPYNGKASEGEQKSFGMFESEVQRRVALFERTRLGGKRQVDSDELKKIVDGVLVDKVRTGGFFGIGGSEKPVSVIPQDQLGKAYVNVNGRTVKLSQIPSESREQYAAKLKAKGFPVTQSNIAQLWAADNPEN